MKKVRNRLLSFLDNAADVLMCVTLGLLVCFIAWRVAVFWNVALAGQLTIGVMAAVIAAEGVAMLDRLLLKSIWNELLKGTSRPSPVDAFFFALVSVGMLVFAGYIAHAGQVALAWVVVIFIGLVIAPAGRAMSV